MKGKNASLPPGVRAERCWCGRLAKVKEVVDFSDKFGMKYFMCASYDHDPPRQTSSSSSRPASPPPLCMWFHWIDQEQPDWARREVEEKQRRAWAMFHEEERFEKAMANDKAERERQIQKLRAEQARNREVNQKRMDDEAARRSICIIPVDDDDVAAVALDRKATTGDEGDEVDANLGRTDFPHPLYVSHLLAMESEICLEIPDLGESNWHLCRK
ncbi:hypothetical protein QYE76_011852 [Lolium multiflorum]|uniref:Uncharacterized protein n=1 Tax=Lolium multiflorum TaxID=4521 RepID=A0AAD8UYX1_LOLMU|nr:hypothetical protein QYE76_008340 [Lolium multiflorum]KAK1695155.1 hypothetical protein QYE76_011852 [Lolium multiflorum]